VTSRTKHWLKGLAKYGIGFGLLGYVLATNWAPKGGNPGIAGLLQQTPDYAALAGVFVLCVAVLAIQYARWYVLVRALDLPFTVGGAFRLGLVGTFYNVFLPGSVGGDFVKAYFIARGAPDRRAAAVATVVIDRIVGLFGLLWFSAVIGGAYWLAGDARVAGNEYLQKIIRVCGILVGLTVVGWVVMGFLPPHRADRFAGRLTKIPKAGKALAEVWYAVWTYRQRPWTVYQSVALTAVCHVAMVLMFHLGVRVFLAPGAEPGTLAEHFVIGPVGFIAQAFFPAPGGVGGGEAIFGYLYTLLGRPDQVGLMGRLTLRVAEWACGLAGLVAFLRMRSELPAVEQEAEEEGLGGHEEPTPATTALAPEAKMG
jgi:glycosyltransferase 2 family protein